MIKENCKYPVYFTLDIKQAYKAGIKPEKYIDVMGKNMVNFHKGEIFYLKTIKNKLIWTKYIITLGIPICGNLKIVKKKAFIFKC